MKIPNLLSILSAAVLALPLMSVAGELAVTAKSVHVRAGPAREYPVVVILAPGSPLTVEGCLSNYTWCDVTLYDGTRGWVYAGNLSYDDNVSYLPILDYGSSVGIPILSFNFVNYWDSYYRVHPWYRDRQHWIDNPLHPGPRATPGPEHIGQPPGRNPARNAPDRPHQMEPGRPMGQRSHPTMRAPDRPFPGEPDHSMRHGDRPETHGAHPAGHPADQNQGSRPSSRQR